MLEFEVLGDMNKFMSLQKFLVEIKGKNSRNIDGDLRRDNNAANTNAPHISINALRAFFSECTVSAKGGKISSTKGNYEQKAIVETELLQRKTAKNT